MSTLRFAYLFLFMAFCLQPSVRGAQGPNLGRPLTPEEIRKIDMTVVPDGRGLPPGNGSVSAGPAAYAKSCQSSHGPQGAGKPQDHLTGRGRSLASGNPVKKPASDCPAAAKLFNSIR